MKAIEVAGFKPGADFALGLDVAATEFFEDGKYAFEKSSYTGETLTKFWVDLVKDYPLATIEDPLAEDDWDGYVHLTEQLGDKVQIVGDDFFVTNPVRLKKGIDLKAANSILVKVNQIGTLSETLDAVAMAQRAGYTAIISHRSGRDRGHHDRRHRGRDRRRPDQDGCSGPLRPRRQVQPAAAHRRGTGRGGDLRRPRRVPQIRRVGHVAWSHGPA